MPKPNLGEPQGDEEYIKDQERAEQTTVAKDFGSILFELRVVRVFTMTRRQSAVPIPGQRDRERRLQRDQSIRSLPTPDFLQQLKGIKRSLRSFFVLEIGVDITFGL